MGVCARVCASVCVEGVHETGRTIKKPMLFVLCSTNQTCLLWLCDGTVCILNTQPGVVMKASARCVLVIDRSSAVTKHEVHVPYFQVIRSPSLTLLHGLCSSIPCAQGYQLDV